jgi:hypothetical protein
VVNRGARGIVFQKFGAPAYESHLGGVAEGGVGRVEVLATDCGLRQHLPDTFPDAKERLVNLFL